VRDGVDLLQQARALAQQFGARFGGACLARAAVEQQHVQRILDLAHAVGQGAGHQAELARCGGKAAGLGDHLQHGQAVGGQHIARVLHGGTMVIQFF
jgi:hypothetical protein